MPALDENLVMKVIARASEPITPAEISRDLRLRGASIRELRQMLRSMEERGLVSRGKGLTYTRPSGRSGAILGALEVTSKGFGFVRPRWPEGTKKPFEGDIFISPRDMGTALDGDLVRCELMRTGRDGVSGRVVGIEGRGRETIVGWYQQTNRKGGEVHPRNTRIDRRIMVPLPDAEMNLKDFEWVEVEITEYTEAPGALLGKVKSRIGADGERGIDVLLVLRDRGIIEEFPESVEKEVELLRFDWEKDLVDRTELRQVPTITIDPKTAKDFDDALSVDALPEGGWLLLVHIADVSHFLKPKTALDREAQERSTSVYPVDRVVPMLPTKISNHLCSLVPHEDRLTVTAQMVITPEGLLGETEFFSSVIHSDRRMAYEEVQEIFDDNKETRERCADVLPLVEELQRVARVLRKRRFERGALDLDIPQLQVIFDEAGKPSDLQFYPRFEAHQVVEECMLIANEAVAQYLTKKELPLLFRVHETADEDRLKKLIPTLAAFGIKLGGRGGKITPLTIQQALGKAQELEGGHIIRRLILRALKRAQYTPTNVGHFGLASECYCHFTSPIRRYPDVVVHRQIKSVEAGGPPFYKKDDNELEELGEHTSSRERRAQEAEWESTTIKALEFMKQFEGDEFPGYISSLQSFGLFIELERYPVEGLIKLSSLENDFYEEDESGIALVGRKTGHRLKLGDKIMVRIEKVNALASQMDLRLVEEPLSGYRKKKRKG